MEFRGIKRKPIELDPIDNDTIIQKKAKTSLIETSNQQIKVNEIEAMKEYDHKPETDKIVRK